MTEELKNNWVDEILDRVSEDVARWPEWMRRPEVRAPEKTLAAQNKRDEHADI